MSRRSELSAAAPPSRVTWRSRDRSDRLCRRRRFVRGTLAGNERRRRRWVPSSARAAAVIATLSLSPFPFQVAERCSLRFVVLGSAFLSSRLLHTAPAPTVRSGRASLAGFVRPQFAQAWVLSFLSPAGCPVLLPAYPDPWRPGSTQPQGAPTPPPRRVSALEGVVFSPTVVPPCLSARAPAPRCR